MMDEHMARRASLFADSEMESSEAVDYLGAIEHHEDARRTLGRYYLIGEVLRAGHTPPGFDLAERVERRLALEPAILAPARPGSVGFFRRQLVTSALAASLAAMAIFVWNGVSGLAGLNSNAVAHMDSGMVLTQAQIDPEMQTYLLVHSGSSHVAGSGTLMPYMRMVSYEK